MKYNKLVRDKIPDIIKSKGKTPKTHIATNEEYIIKLKEKLIEEINEFNSSNSSEELADILEVIYSIAENNKISLKKLVSLRIKKAKERGSFKNKIILDEVND